MKRFFFHLIVLSVIFCSVSCAAAYESLWDRLQETPAGNQFPDNSFWDGSISPDPETPQQTPFRTEGMLRLDSVQLLNDTDEKTASVLQDLSGLKIDFTSQDKEAPRSSFALSLNGTPLISYELQATTPCFVRSSLLGPETYMIYPEDQFEEKLTDSVYKFMKMMGAEDLPEKEQVYALIRNMRATQGNFTTDLADIPFSPEKNLDRSAFEYILLGFMTRFEPTEPSEGIGYFFTEIPYEEREFTWPDENSLPAVIKPDSAVSARFNSSDFLMLIDAFEQFLLDNPDYAESLNQQIRENMANADPAAAELENADPLSELNGYLREAFQTEMKDSYLLIKADLDKSSKPVYITAEFGNAAENAGTRFSVLSISDEDQTSSRVIWEFTMNLFSAVREMPAFHGLIVNTGLINEETGRRTMNFRFSDKGGLEFEYAQVTDSYRASTMTRVSDTNVQYILNGQHGNAQIFTTGIPNAFNGEDTSTQIIYTHLSDGIPAFIATITGEKKSAEALPALTAADAVPASAMTEDDYDQAAANIFSKIMLLSAKFSK